MKTTTTFGSFALAALSLAFGLSACSPEQSGRSCEQVSECFEGEVCRAGVCRTPAAEQEDAGADVDSSEVGDASPDSEEPDSGEVGADGGDENDADAGDGEEEEVVIRLSWSHPDWEESMSEGPDLDLFYCNNRALAFRDTASEHCIFWAERFADWTVGGEELDVSLVVDSRTPASTEEIEHEVMSESITHVAVHYYETDDIDVFSDEPVQVLLEVSINGGEFMAVQTQMREKDEIWYATRIDWEAEGGPALLPGEPCVEGCSADGHYQEFPVEIP